ncbi:MAG: tetratricopeptide repeat protein [Planctomycetes bacterium]|nr:tetratricopeptide repeat protein [Planctomycetota bacterium]
MKTVHLMFVVALLGASSCAGLRRDASPARLDADDAVGAPVYQPMLVVAMPALSGPGQGRKPMEALQARNTPIGDVLLTMFRDSDVNLLIDQEVQAVSCTCDIKKSTVEETFEALLRSLDLGYEWDGSFLRIRNRVRATIFVDMLAASAGGGGGGGSDSGGGGGGSSGGTGFWSALEETLPQILGSTGNAVLNQSASAIHVEGSPSGVARLRDVIETTVRRANTQVSIEARILEVRLTDEHSLGVNWGLLPGLFKSNKTGLAQNGSVISQTAASGGTALNFGILDTGDFSVFVDALETQGQVRVLSSPRVSTMNNVAANIAVTDQLPVINREVIDDEGVARTEYSVEFVEAGVTVQVTPLIGEDGLITVAVAPTITEQTGTVVTPDGLVEEPILSNRSAATVVRVADGQAIVLGGLRSTRKDEARSGIPFLMDIPWLGQVFSSTVQNREEVELMILLVPRVLDANWIDEEVRRGAHRLVSLRRPFQWSSIGQEGFRGEDWSGGALQGQPIAAKTPELRFPAPVPPALPVEQGLTVTRSGLASRLMERAQQAIDESQFRSAIQLLEQALDLDPRRIDALVVCGVLLQRQSDLARARTLLDRALDVAPEDVAALTARGSLELADGSPHAARRYLEVAHQKVGTSWTACNLAAAMLLTGQVEEARTFLRKVADPNSPAELHANLAFAEFATGNVDAARQSLDRALTAGADARNPRIHALTRMVATAPKAP